jgi:hypothetical protein
MNISDLGGAFLSGGGIISVKCVSIKHGTVLSVE